ncbi:Hypp1673 [Branchiostoma lanceolatum]|uniref:Hypp1673 protein n=1 Tax=Branchiostoma lanceolatum TaxID=7740 RepID=A0A8K0ELQ8_BRALA|nr:Hypp1673 [Branchiostoma lanceolatum]
MAVKVSSQKRGRSVLNFCLLGAENLSWCASQTDTGMDRDLHSFGAVLGAVGATATQYVRRGTACVASEAQISPTTR